MGATEGGRTALKDLLMHKCLNCTQRWALVLGISHSTEVGLTIQVKRTLDASAKQNPRNVQYCKMVK